MALPAAAEPAPRSHFYDEDRRTSEHYGERRHDSEYRGSQYRESEYRGSDPRMELRAEDIKMPEFDPNKPGMTIAGWFHQLDVMIDTSERFKDRKWDP